jgi:hypothetical protein
MKNLPYLRNIQRKKCNDILFAPKKKKKILQRKWNKLQNEVVSFEIVFGMVHGRSYENFQKNPSHTNSDYSSLEFFSEMLKFSKKKTIHSKTNIFVNENLKYLKIFWKCCSSKRAITIGHKC